MFKEAASATYHAHQERLFNVIPSQRRQGSNVRQSTLINCEEVGVVKGVHLLSSEVRSVTTALKVVEEVQEKVQEIKDE